MRVSLMVSLWHRLIDILISLLVPPLSDKPFPAKDILGPAEVDVVFKWLGLLKAFFNASENGVEHGVPSNLLQGGVYRDLVMVGQYLDLPLPQLKERCTGAVRAASSGSSKSLMGLGRLRIGDEDEGERMAEVLLRICRTRPETSEFLGQQIAALNKARVERQAGVL